VREVGVWVPPDTRQPCPRGKADLDRPALSPSASEDAVPRHHAEDRTL